MKRTSSVLSVSSVPCVLRATALLSLWLLVMTMIGCQSTHARRDPTGELFPTVAGTSLAGESIAMPAAWRGEPVLLLVGFEQDTQFDLDRWALGLVQLGIELRAVEIPTIPGLVPTVISERIDSGMRRGIPEEDWASVVTVYEEAEAIARFTGNENPLTGRILLLDASGRVVFFHDRGYSTGSLLRLRDALSQIKD